MPGLFTERLDNPSLRPEKKMAVPMRFPLSKTWLELDTLYLYVPSR